MSVQCTPCLISHEYTLVHRTVYPSVLLSYSSRDLQGLIVFDLFQFIGLRNLSLLAQHSD